MTVIMPFLLFSSLYNFEYYYKVSASPSQQIFKTFSSVRVFFLTHSFLLVVSLSIYAKISLLQPILMSVPANYLFRAVTHLQFRLCLTVCKQRSIQIKISVDWPSYFDSASGLRILRYPNKFRGTSWGNSLTPCATSR